MSFYAGLVLLLASVLIGPLLVIALAYFGVIWPRHITLFGPIKNRNESSAHDRVTITRVGMMFNLTRWQRLCRWVQSIF